MCLYINPYSTDPDITPEYYLLEGKFDYLMGLKYFTYKKGVLYPSFIKENTPYKLKQHVYGIYIKAELSWQRVDLNLPVFSKGGLYEHRMQESHIDSLGIHVSMWNNLTKTPKAISNYGGTFYLANIPVIFHPNSIQLLDVEDVIVKKLIIPFPSFVKDSFHSYPFHKEYEQLFNDYLSDIYNQLEE